MADTVTTLSLITLAQEYRGDIVRQINRRTVLLKMLPIVPGAGLNVAFAPEADGQVAENYSDGADAVNFGGDVQASGILAWGLYRANVHLSDLASDAAGSSSTPMENRRLWAHNIINSTAKLATTLNAAMYTGAGTGTTIAGLDMALGSTTNTYAGINRSSGGNAYWQPNVIDPGSPTAPTLALIRSDIATIYTQCGENPDLAVCSPAVFNKVGGLFDATRRQIDVVQTARGAIRLDFGWQALEVDGTLFVKDKDATANQIYYLNTNHVKIEYLPPVGVPDSPPQQIEADDGFGAVMLGMRYKKLATLGASERAQINTTLQLVVDRPNSCGIRKNVNPA